MQSKDKESGPAFVRWIPFFVGFLIGIIFVLTMGGWFLEGRGILGIGSLSELRYLTISKHRLFFYVLEVRWRVVIVMIFMSVTLIGRMFRIACTAWYGFSFGTMLMACCLEYHVKGLWFVLLSQFPHMFLYVPAYLMLCDINRILYQCAQNRQIDMSVRDIGSRLLLLAFLVMAGCLFESYVNPMIIMKIIKKF